MRTFYLLLLSSIIYILFLTQSVFAAADLQIVQLYSGAPAYRTNIRQAIVCPKAVITNAGNTASTGTDTVSFRVAGYAWNYKISIPSVEAGDTVLFEVPQNSGYTPSSAASYTTEATLGVQTVTSDFIVTEQLISHYRSQSSIIFRDMEAGSYGNTYRLKNSERFASVDIDFSLGGMGAFPELDFSMSVFSVNEATMELTEVYTSPLMHRPSRGSYEGTYPFNTPLLQPGLYLITVNQFSNEPLFITGNSYYESTIYSVSGSTAVEELNGSFSIVLKTSQVRDFAPENGARKVALDSIPAITFFENHTLSDASKITITPDPGGVSANIQGNKLSIAHNNFNYYTNYRIKINSGAYSGQLDTFGWSFTTQMEPSSCNAPTDITAVRIDTSSIIFEWIENNPVITLWDIKYGPKGFNVSSEGTLVQNISQTSYTINGLAPGQNYDIYVRSHCTSSGTSAWSEKYSFAAKRIPVRLNAVHDATINVDGVFWGGRFISFMSGNPNNVQAVGYNMYNIGLRHGEFIDGILYMFRLDSVFMYDKNYDKVGGFMTGKGFNDAAYDYSTATMYSVTGTASTGGAGTLCTVDLHTGTVVELGNMTPSMSAVCCTKDGVLYGISNSEGTKGNLYRIDKNTRNTVSVLQTGRVPNGMQSLMIDHNTGRMFWLNNSITSCNLVELDVQTGEVIDLGFIGGGQANQNYQYYHSLYSVYDRAKGTMPERFATKVDVASPIWAAFKNISGAGNLNSVTVDPPVSGLNITLRNDTVFIAHDSLNYNTVYTVTVPASAVAGLGGNYSWKFTTMSDPNGCHKVEEFEIVNIDYNSVTLKWKNFGHSEGWQVAAGASGFDPSTSEYTYNVLSDSVTIEGLMDGFQYDFYVRTICDSTPEYESYGPWSDGVSGTTMLDCRYAITDFPYREGFEDLSSIRCYENAGSLNWLQYRNNGSGERPHGGEYFYRAVGENVQSALITPKFDLSFLLNNPVIDFWYKIPAGEGEDYFEVYYNTGGDSVWHSVWTKTTSVEEWTRQIIPLPNVSSNYRIAFRAILNGGEGVWLDDISIHEFYGRDIIADKLIQPQSGHDHTAAEQVQAVIYNGGMETADTILTGYSIDGVVKDNRKVVLNIPSSESVNYTFPVTFDMSAEKNYIIKVWASINGDADPLNDTITTKVENFKCGVTKLPWTEDFGRPERFSCWTVISSNTANDVALSNDVLVFSSYYPDYDGDNYNQYAITPEIPVTALAKSVSFNYGRMLGTETFRIGYSTTTNGTGSFTWLPKVNADASDGSSWKTYYNTTIPGDAKYIAIHYCPEGSQYYLYIDNLRIGNAAAIDAEVTNILQPVSGPKTQAETVQVKVSNFGESGFSSAQLTLYSNGDSITTEMLNSTILPLNSHIYTFNKKIDLSVENEYSVKVKVFVSGDGVPTNDTLTKVIENYQCKYEFPWLESFEWETLSPCWEVTAADMAAYNWSLTKDKKHSGNSSMRQQYVNNCTDHRLISPTIVMPSDKEYKFVFWNFNEFAEDYDKEGSRNSVLVREAGSEEWVETWFAENVSAAWAKEGFSLAAYKGKNIQVAFKYSGNFSHSWYVDDISLEDLAEKDIQLVAVEKPLANDFNLSVAENVTVLLRNNGSATVKNLPLLLRFNGVPVATETVTDSIVSGAQISYTFNRKIDLSSAGDYVIAVAAQLPGDANPADNTVTKHVTITKCLISEQDLPMNFGFEVFTWPLSCWTLIDKDGDGYFWNVGNNPSNAHSGNSFGYSESFMILVAGELEFPLTPDNWIISPPIRIPSENGAELSFWKGAADYNLYEEHYAVLISTTDRNPASFTTIYQETLNTNAWEKRVLQLDAYKGQTVYIAFRHYDCTGQFGLLLDDIQVKETFNYNKDAAVTGFEKIESTTYGTEFPVVVTLYNNGFDTIKNAVITWTKDGAAQPQVQYNGALAYEQQANVVLSASESFTVDDHVITAKVHLAGDENAANDSIVVAFFSKPYKTAPYITEFNGSLDEWQPYSYSGGLNFYWANQPHTFITLQSPTLSNGYAIYDLVKNGLGGPSNALVSLVSPAFDFSGISQDNRLSISFYHWTRNETSTECSLQYSTDNFKSDVNTLWSWNTVIGGEIKAGKQMVPISHLRGLKDVRFRFLHYGNVAYGWAIDDIYIGDVEYENEVAVISAQEEHALNREGDNVTFYATVQNNGFADVINLPVTFSVNDTILNATVSSLSYGKQQTVSVLWRNAPAGSYTVTVSLPADEDTANNKYMFAKHIANAYQLAEGFEDTLTLDDWVADGDMILTSTISTDSAIIKPFVYEGVVSAVGGALYHTEYEAIIHTPLLNVSEGDKVVFYSKYLNKPSGGEMPTVRILLSEDGDIWYTSDDDVFTLEPEWKDYTCTLKAGQFYVGFFLSGPLSTGGNSVYITLDHIIAPPIANAFDVSFNVSSSKGGAINDATITFDGVPNAAGNYLFTGIMPGVYSYTVDKSDKEPVSGSVAVINKNVTVDVALDDIAGNELVAADGGFTAAITPNPVRGSEAVLMLQGINDPVHVEICDLSGKTLLNSGTLAAQPKITLNTRDLKAGAYIVKIVTEKTVVTRKLIRL